MPYSHFISIADKKQVCVFGTQKLPRPGRGKLALRPVVAKVFSGSPATSEQWGKIRLSDNRLSC